MTSNVWRLVAEKYFPSEEESRFNPDDFVTWTCLPEGYRRTDGKAKIPDCIVVKKRTVTEQGTCESRQDMLIIECKEANENTQSGWENLLGEATERLARFSPSQSTLIAAVGHNYMFFFWDHTAASAAPLTICPRDRPDRSHLDPRLRPLGICPWYSNMRTMTDCAARAEIPQDIEYTGALSILGDEQSNPEGVISLENFLNAVRVAQLHGPKELNQG